MTSLSQALSGSIRATNCESGWTYQDYLKSFLYTMPDKELAYGMMEMVEYTMWKSPSCKNFRMDYMIGAVDVNFEYSADTLFWDLMALGSNRLEKVGYQHRLKFSYY